jgi:cephalosporin hydroxylase
MTRRIKTTWDRFAARFAIKEFHKLYYGHREQTWQNTLWLGTKILKCPLDAWLYQEIIYEIRPEVIIETGTCYGGSAHFMACLCEIIGCGHVVTIDVESQAQRPSHHRITYLTGSSTSPGMVSKVRNIVSNKSRVLVILDSDHSKAHVLQELNAYSLFVTRGSYLIVEDTNINGHPVRPDFGDGPFEAITEFLARDKRFVIDHQKEKFFMSFNPSGYLKRVE